MKSYVILRARAIPRNPVCSPLDVRSLRFGGTTQPRADESIVTLSWFTRNRFFPLREGSTWKEETAAIRKIEIEKDILAPLGELPLAQVDKVLLQTQLNDLAKKLSQARVQHARFYMKAIFEEAIDQGFVEKILHESWCYRSSYGRRTKLR